MLGAIVGVLMILLLIILDLLITVGIPSLLITWGLSYTSIDASFWAVLLIILGVRAILLATSFRK